MPQIRTLVWADLVDSTAAHLQLGERDATAWWLEHDRRSRELLEQWQGVEIKRSDGFLAMFDDPCRGAGFIAEYHAMLDSLVHCVIEMAPRLWSDSVDGKNEPDGHRERAIAGRYA